MPRRRQGHSPLEPIERASRDELQSIQLERLTWSIRHTYDQVPSFRAKCEALEAHPDDLRTLDDLRRFPFTTKQDLRGGYPFGLFAMPREQVVRVHASSGTTGKPTVVGYTARDIETWAASPATSCTSRTATACSLGVWAHTMAPRSWAARSSQCPAVNARRHRTAHEHRCDGPLRAVGSDWPWRRRGVHREQGRSGDL